MNNELQHLSRRLTGLSMKRPGLALGVWGEAGIGKTHTTLALLRGAPCQTWSVHATQALEKTIGQIPHPKKPTMWLEKILERLKNNESLETGMLNQALIALLAANAPIVLHVEDLHEASLERLEFYKQLAVVVGRTRGVGLIVTSRAQPPEGFESIRLAPLNRDESDALLEAEVGAKLPSEALVWLFTRAAGNPLFTLEFFRLLARNGSVWNDGQRWRFRIPERETMPVTVEALIEQVLHETASTAALENAIGAKAMLNLGASKQLWAEIAGLTLEDLNAIKQELEHLGVISNAEFAHPLFREVVLAQMPSEQRQGFARKALETLKDEPRVAAGFVKDANLEASESLLWFEGATRIASDVGDKILVGRLKAKAFEYATGDLRATLAFEVAELLQHHDQIEAIRFATVAVNLQPEDAEAIFLQALLLAAQKRDKETERVLESLPPQDASSERGLSVRIECLIRLQNYRSAIELWQAHSSLLKVTSPRTGLRIGSAMVHLGETANAFALASTLLERDDLDELVQFSLVELCGICRVYESNFVSAEEFFNTAIQIAQEANLINHTSTVLFNHGIALQQLGRYREAASEVEASARIAGEIGDGFIWAMARGLLGEQLFELGDYEQAEEILLESRSIVARGQVSEHLIDIEGNLCDLYREWDTTYGKTMALKHGHAALTGARQRNNPRYLPEGLFYAAITEAQVGNATRALELAQEERDLAAVRQEPRQVYKAGWAMATALNALGHRDKSLHEFRQAQDQALKVGHMLHVHKIGLEIDRLTNDVIGVQKRLLWFEERGLMNGVNIAHHYFPNLRTKSNHTPTTPSTETSFHLEVLGSMQVKLEGQSTTIRGRKRQELLALLLEARISGRSEVSKLELVEKLYPDADELQSNAGLRDVIYQLRSSLGEGALMTTANGYALGNLSSDVEEFLKNGDTKLWRGVYLEGLLLETSDTVRESVYLALRTRAEALLETDPVEATRVARILCEADPYDLEAVRLTLTGLRTLQNHRSLSRVYEQACTRFLEIGEVLPVRWQDFLTKIGTTA